MAKEHKHKKHTTKRRTTGIGKATGVWEDWICECGETFNSVFKGFVSPKRPGPPPPIGE